MIKFFRNIRLRLLSEDKTSKYLKYAVGEIALVVIGILIALSINNWNSRITDNKNEALYLKRIKIDVAQQIDVLKTISGFCEFETSLADSILREYKTQKDLRNINELHKRLSSLMYTIGINKANTTFNELSSTGQLNLIKSTELRSGIIEFYEEVEGLEHLIVANRENVYYPNVFPVFIEVVNLNARDFFPLEKELTSNYFTAANQIRIEEKLRNLDLQHSLLNAVTLVLMTNKTIKISTDQLIRDGEDLLELLNYD